MYMHPDSTWSLAYWFRAVTSALQRLREEKCDLETSLDHIVRPYLKTEKGKERNKKQNKTKKPSPKTNQNNPPTCSNFYQLK